MGLSFREVNPYERGIMNIKVVLAGTFLAGSYLFASYAVKKFVDEMQGENQAIRDSYRALIFDMSKYLTPEELAQVQLDASFRSVLATAGINPITGVEYKS